MLLKNTLTIGFFLTVNIMVTGQKNVGINKVKPEETLDVGGNINVDGVLKVNGIGGNAGQVLMANGTSGMSWTTPSITTPSSFQYHVTYTGSASFWTVPAGVTRFMVEAWGGGGGGSSWSGGGAGGYVRGFFENAVPTTTVSLAIGTGGDGNTYNGVNGQSTQVIYDGKTIRGLGGEGASISSTNWLISGGNGGGFYQTGTFLNYYGIKGEDGAIGIQEYYQYNSSGGGTYNIRKIFGADGGNAPNTTTTGGKGGFQQFSGGIEFRKSATPGTLPGGGGGGGYSYFSTASSGDSGGNGMVIIHY